MAMNNRDRVGRGFDLLAEGLLDPVDGVMTEVFHTKDWSAAWALLDQQKHGGPLHTFSKNDVQVQLRAITEYGRSFNSILSRSQQAYASELRETRNRWAHTQPFSSDDTIRALSTTEYLLNAVDAPDSAADVRKLRDDLQRTVYEDHTRKINQRKVVMVDPTQGMKPWREVIRPHDDVASGRFTSSEFAADLYQVAVSKTACEPGNAYGDPVEFFNRTYLTEGLQDLLTRAVRRLIGDGSSPVVNLQTNFGGGKTHSLLALYHLFGGKPVSRLSADVQDLMAGLHLPGSGNGDPWRPGDVRRVALVGTMLNVAKPSVKDDGTQVHTIWGELAWQLGGSEGYAIVAENDRTGTSPGALLYDLLRRYSPCLILIDEWVAYARQLVGRDGLPAGTFEDQFTFAQTLTEAVAATPHCMLVVSIPASEDGGKGSDSEIGGMNGQRALDRLQNIIRRKADQWRPSTRDESFEIVRKRLFEEPDAEAQGQIALTARKFVDMYRKNPTRYPSGVTEGEYDRRIRASYPLHPELLDRLYEDWSGLENFQRTRGVLTLVSAIISALWASNDTSPLILPGNVPLETESVGSNLTQYLPDSWKPIIDADVAGPDSTAAKIDVERPVLGQRHLTQRIARTVFMGTAPRTTAQNPSISEQTVRLGTAMLGDQEGNYGVALSMLEQRSTYFFAENSRYRYSIHPSLSRTVRDRAERLRERPEVVYAEIAQRLQLEGKPLKRGMFRRVCVAPESTDGIADVDEVTLVIVHPQWSAGRGESPESDTMRWIRDAVDHRGAGQRANRNMVVFLVADGTLLEQAEDEARLLLGWKSIDTNEGNLTRQQVDQARTAVENAGRRLDERIRSAYCWCVYPVQPDRRAGYRLAMVKVPGDHDSMAVRTGRRLSDEGLLIDNYSPVGIAGDILPYMQSSFQNGVLPLTTVWECITRFPYMPRLVGRTALNQALEALPGAAMDAGERFAMADEWDPGTGRFRNLVIPGITPVEREPVVTDDTVIVEWERANEYHKQMEGKDSTLEDTTIRLVNRVPEGGTSNTQLTSGIEPVIKPSDHFSTVPQPLPTATKTRYYGTLELNPDHVSQMLSKLNEGVLDPMRLARANISLSLEIHADKPDGFDESTMRTVTDYAERLGFANSGFEEE